jgi:hypothetical protein
MRLIKMGLVGITGLIVLLTIMGLVIPSSVKITRGVVIQADSARVVSYLADASKWKQWMPWLQSDSGVLIQQSPTTTGAGAFVRWKSMDGRQQGTLTLTAIKEGEYGILHEFKGMNPAQGGFRIRSIQGAAHQTEVQWFLEYRLKWYPWERFSGIFMDHMIGPVLDQALQQLSKITSTSSVLPS